MSRGSLNPTGGFVGRSGLIRAARGTFTPHGHPPVRVVLVADGAGLRLHISGAGSGRCGSLAIVAGGFGAVDTRCRRVLALMARHLVSTAAGGGVPLTNRQGSLVARQRLWPSQPQGSL